MGRGNGASSDDDFLLGKEAAHLAARRPALYADCARRGAREVEEQTACDHTTLQAEARVVGLVSECGFKVCSRRRAALAVACVLLGVEDGHWHRRTSLLPASIVVAGRAVARLRACPYESVVKASAERVGTVRDLQRPVLTAPLSHVRSISV